MANLSDRISTSSWSYINGTSQAFSASIEARADLNSISVTSGSSCSITATFTSGWSFSDLSHIEYLRIVMIIQNQTNSKSVQISRDFPVTGSSIYPNFVNVVTSLLDLNTGNNTISYNITAYALDERGNETEGVKKATYSSSSTMTVVRATNTGSPTGVSVSPSSVSAAQTVTINWSAASNGTNNPVTGYTVYYSDDGGTTWKNFASVSSSTRSQAVAGPATSGTTRLYFVRADAAYNTQPMNSAIVSCSYISAGITAPTNFAVNKDAVGTASESLTFTWTNSTLIGTTGTITYQIQYSKNGGTWTNLTSTTVTTGTLTYTFSISRAVGDVFQFRVYGKTSSYTSTNSNTVTVNIMDVYTCYSTASQNYYWTNNSVAIGTKSDSDGNLTLLSQYDYTENSSMQMQAQAFINTTSLRMRKAPGFETSGTGWENNVWKVGSSTVYLNKPEQYICYGGSGGNADDNGKMLYVTTPNAGTLNKLAFAYASSGSYIQGGNISYGNNRSVFRLSSGLTMVIKRLPFGCDASSVGGSSIQIGNWFSDGSAFTAVPIVMYSIQHTYDGYAAMPRLYRNATATSGGELYIGSWQANDTTSVNRTKNLAGIATVIAIGKKA